MNLSRRRFLASLGGAPLVFGIDDLFDDLLWDLVRGRAPQDKAASRPATRTDAKDPFAAALDRMAESDAPGLGFVIPESDAARAALLGRLAFWLAGSSSRAAGLCLRAVLVVAPRSRLPASQSDTVVLFDRTGARRSGVAEELGKRPSRVELLALHALVDDHELARRARTKPASPEPGQKELERLLQQPEDQPLDETLVAKVAEHCVPGGYPIWRWRSAAKNVERYVAGRPILAAFQARSEPEGRLPFGVSFAAQIEHVGTGCGTSDDTDPEVGMPMFKCGMGMMQVRTLKLLELTGQQR